ncbi:MAG: efflux RND transporter permease subunit [Chthoniobacteraceae bacterium]
MPKTSLRGGRAALQHVYLLTVALQWLAAMLPIMWSHRLGAEVMKPLATPVIGGMISSLVHILIVTPVIFLWLRAREFRRILKPDEA